MTVSAASFWPKTRLKYSPATALRPALSVGFPLKNPLAEFYRFKSFLVSL
jgi:hypothetical protein